MTSFLTRNNNLPLTTTASNCDINTKIIDHEEEKIVKYNCRLFTGACATWIMAGSGVGLKENQDNMLNMFIEYDSKLYNVINIFDGHGISGLTYSSEANELFKNFIKYNFVEILKNPYETLTKIFFDVNTQLFKLKELYPIGGTTVTINIIGDGLYICANLGDCESYIKIDAPLESIQVKYNNNITSTEEYFDRGIIKGTTDHNYKIESEARRVLELGGMIKYQSLDVTAPLIDVYNVIKDEEDNIISICKNDPKTQIDSFPINANGDLSVYHYNKLGSRINLTRSLGDFEYEFMKKEPDIVHIEFEKGHKIKLISGSDGYFNCYKSEVIYDILLNDITPENICSNGYIQVGKTFGHADADNTTICAIDFIP
jgi:serine/threonine protein phosphatase PrpC